MAKKIQSNICGMLNSFHCVTSVIYGYDRPKVAGLRSRPVYPRGRRARGRLADDQPTLHSSPHRNAKR